MLAIKEFQMQNGKKKNVGRFLVLLLLGSVPVLVGAGILNIYDFLSVTDRVPARILVVEDWFYQHPSFREVLREYKRGGYDEIIVVGNREKAGSCRMPGAGNTDLAVKKLEKLGLDAPVTAVTGPYTGSERTYHSGLALREYFVRHPEKSGDLNLITQSVHARKSRMLYQAALGERYRVGIVSAKGGRCKGGDLWWLSRGCIKPVVWNIAGYFYALALVVKYRYLPLG